MLDGNCQLEMIDLYDIASLLPDLQQAFPKYNCYSFLPFQIVFSLK